MAILTVVIKQWMEWGSLFSDTPYIYMYIYISYYFILNKLRIHLDLETRSVFGKQSAQHATNGERRWGSGMSVEMVPAVIGVICKPDISPPQWWYNYIYIWWILNYSGLILLPELKYPSLSQGSCLLFNPKPAVPLKVSMLTMARCNHPPHSSSRRPPLPQSSIFNG